MLENNPELNQNKFKIGDFVVAKSPEGYFPAIITHENPNSFRWCVMSHTGRFYTNEVLDMKTFKTKLQSKVVELDSRLLT